MRDWLMTDLKDRGCLRAAKRADDTGDTWRPEDGRYSRARRLAKNGFIRKAGVSAMPPHVTYVLTDKGFEELQVADALMGNQGVTQMENRSGIELFWTPPRPGERVLGMVKYEDMIVVATDDGVYVIAPPGKGLMDHEVRKISHDTLRELRDARS